LVDGPLEVAQGLGVEAKLGHVELEVGFVEEAEDDLLAKEGGEAGDAEVHLFALAELELDAAILGEAALGDVEGAHDFNAARDGVLHLERGVHFFGEDAIDAVSDAELFFVRLDVDVAGALFDGVK
jgi:hypothetical protein